MKGSCNCKAVAFELTGELPSMYMCHCTLCQKQGGTGSNAATMVSVDSFIWLQGQDKIKQWKKSSGFNSHFCEDCGSPVPNPIKQGQGQEYMWIPLGLLTDPRPDLVANIHLASKPEWFAYTPSSNDFEGAPGSVDELVSLLMEPAGNTPGSAKTRAASVTLNQDELENILDVTLPAWSLESRKLEKGRDGNCIELKRKFVFNRFSAAIEFMHEVAPACDSADHHPRWENNWRTVTVWLTTWDVGCRLSQRDVQLAKYMDAIYKRYNSESKN